MTKPSFSKSPRTLPTIRRYNLIAVVCLAFLSSKVTADDWQQWLGPERNGNWAASNLPEKFRSDGPKLLWTQGIGPGYSGPAVSANRVILMDRISAPPSGDETFLHQGEVPKNKNFVRQRLPGQERVICFSESDGQVLWEHRYECPYSTVTTYAIGPRATPTIDDNRVYTVGAEGDLRCLRISDGKVIWSKNYKTDYLVTTPNWGFTSPPLVDEERLICIVGGDSSGCVAFDKFTGVELWRSLTSTEPGYSAPVIRTLNGHRQLLIWNSESLHGLNPVNGKSIWSVNFPSTYAMSVATPQVIGTSIFLMCFNGKSCVIEVSKDGTTAEIKWEGDRQTGIDGVHNTAQLTDGHIYGCGNGGRYICARLADGERLWETFQPSSSNRPITWGNVFTVRLSGYRDRYYLLNDHGEIISARMTPEAYSELDRAFLIPPTHQVAGRKLVWSHPAFANGNIYLRNDRELRCFQLAKTGEPKLERESD